MKNMQQIRVVATLIASEEGRLVFLDESLVAVLVKLSDAYGDLENRWFVETMFGPHAPARGSLPIVDTLDAALNWIAQRLSPDSTAD